MKQHLTEQTAQAVEYLDRMAEGRLPVSDIAVRPDSELNLAEVVRSMYFIRDVLNALSAEEVSSPKVQKRAKQQFPVECLKSFAYEKDQTIMNFVAQLKNLAGNPEVKGISTKKITDWLKAEGYLQDTIDSVSKEKITMITEKGVEKGIYSEARTTRLGQAYAVIVYSEKAQLWIVENLKDLV